MRWVESGRLTPKTANALAQRKLKFIGTLANDPSLEKYDPMRESYWTLAMALAWAIWRSPEKVREYWNDWRLRKHAWEKATDLAGNHTGGFLLLRLQSVTLQDVWRVAAENLGVIADEERDRLWRYLEEHQLEASAIDPATKKPVIIPHTAWPHIGKINFYDGDEESVSGLDGMTILYSRVLIPRIRVLELWTEGDFRPDQHRIPEPSSTGEPAAKRKRIAASNIPRLLHALDTFYVENPGSTRTEAEAALKAEFGKIPRSIVRSTFKEVPSQGKAGRKPAS